MIQLFLLHRLFETSLLHPCTSSWLNSSPFDIWKLTKTLHYTRYPPTHTQVRTLWTNYFYTDNCEWQGRRTILRELFYLKINLWQNRKKKKDQYFTNVYKTGISIWIGSVYWTLYLYYCLIQCFYPLRTTKVSLTLEIKHSFYQR